MSLPITTSGTPLRWPPASVGDEQRKTALAWWRGPSVDSVLTPEFVHATLGVNDPLKRRVFSPVCADIAATSSGLLFGVVPDLNITPADSEDEDGLSVEDAKKATAHARTAMEDRGHWDTIATAATMGAALGGSYLYVAWHPKVDHPVLVNIPATDAVPDFVFGVLVGVTFTKVIETRGNVVTRLLTKHEAPYRDQSTGAMVPAKVLNGLYVGTPDYLGTAHPDGLDGHMATRGMLPEWIAPEGIRTAWYVPNRSENPHTLNSAEGAADWAGAEDVLAARERAMHALVADTRLSRKRLVVSEEALTTSGRPGAGSTFDDAQEIMTALNLPTAGDGSDTAGVTLIDPTPRGKEYIEEAEFLHAEIVQRSGYSPQTFGHQIDGSAPSGTAMRIREGKTIATITRKRRAWSPVITEIVEALLTIDKIVFQRNIPVARPSLTWGPVREDPKESAETLGLLVNAGAVSVETAVRMGQPALNSEDIAAEVARIREGKAAQAAPDPFRV